MIEIATVFVKIYRCQNLTLCDLAFCFCDLLRPKCSSHQDASNDMHLMTHLFRSIRDLELE